MCLRQHWEAKGICCNTMNVQMSAKNQTVERNQQQWDLLHGDCLRPGFKAVIKHYDHKQLGKDKVFFSLQLSGQRKARAGAQQGRNLEVGIKAEAMEECCLLACSLGFLSLSFYTIQDHQSRASTTHSDLGPPTSTKRMCHGLADMPIWWGHFLKVLV